jgi:hypothetical protein
MDQNVIVANLELNLNQQAMDLVMDQINALINMDQNVIVMNLELNPNQRKTDLDMDQITLPGMDLEKLTLMNKDLDQANVSINMGRNAIVMNLELNPNQLTVDLINA